MAAPTQQQQQPYLADGRLEARGDDDQEDVEATRLCLVVSILTSIWSP